jgi:hypothetical protein
MPLCCLLIHVADWQFHKFCTTMLHGYVWNGLRPCNMVVQILKFEYQILKYKLKSKWHRVLLKLVALFSFHKIFIILNYKS